jgi:hypothetical protein
LQCPKYYVQEHALTKDRMLAGSSLIQQLTGFPACNLSFRLR